MCTYLRGLGIVLVLVASATGQYTSSIIAGGGPPNGSTPTGVSVSRVDGVAVDSSGNLYIATGVHNRVYKVAAGGSLSVLAGNGSAGYSGDGGPASDAQLSFPAAVAVDSAGNVYITDRDNHSIRKVSGGVITTVAGNGAPGYSGDGSFAVNAQLNTPGGLAVDNAGSLFIADAGNYRIRKVSAGVISTVAGNGTYGYSGDGGPATSAQVVARDLAVDSSGTLYLADASSPRVRKVSGGVVSTVAGNGSYGYSGDGGLAISAQVSYVTGVAVDKAGALFIGDSSRVRKVVAGIISTVAGNGGYSYSGDGGLAINAEMKSELSLALDSAANLYIGDADNYRVRRVSAGVISTVAGNGKYGFSGDGGSATAAQISTTSLAADSSGSVYFVDEHRIRKVAGGIVSTVAGIDTGGFSGDGGLAVNAQLSSPVDVTVDGSGSVYIADRGNSRIRKVAGGIISTFAGNGEFGYSGDGGLAVNASIQVGAVVADHAGSVYVADQERIRKVTAGVINVIAGAGPPDGTAGTAMSIDPTSVVVDQAGNVYVLSSTHYRVYKIAPNGMVSTFAGNGTNGYAGDNGPAVAAQLGYVQALAIDSTGAVYIGEFFRVRKVFNGVITTVAGGGGGCTQQITSLVMGALPPVFPFLM